MFAVVIPMYNEEQWVGKLLFGLLSQKDQDFNVYVVDNNSTDNSVSTVEGFIEANHLKDRWFVVHETEKGTGAAADTGFRKAIADGAKFIARTDSDCVPPVDWVSNVKKRFDSNLEFISGRITSRLDEEVSFLQRKLLDGAVILAATFGRFRPSNYGNNMHGKYVMTAGCNLAITARLYEECGGFPRSKIEEVHEDRILVNRVRQHDARLAYCPEVLIHCSSRRVKAWGLKNTLLWYKNHAYKPKEVDIR